MTNIDSVGLYSLLEEFFDLGNCAFLLSLALRREVFLEILIMEELVAILGSRELVTGA
jgi:hypothetical protein